MSQAFSIFTAILMFVITQRLIELRVAKRNTAQLVENGAIEFGKEHYCITWNTNSRRK